MMKTILEGSAKIKVSEETKISRKLPVFFNPVMKLNRDISILLLNSVPDTGIQAALPLAGSGIRGIRMIKELFPGKIKSISLNDHASVKNIEQNLVLNSMGNDERINIFAKEANIFILESKGFDYIDIDPFGSPNPFLENSIVRLARGGILAITATDTSALSGSSHTACMRKYWARPMRNELMHEIGIRILIRKVQLIGAQNEKALIPIFSYSKDHYYRVFFRCHKGKKKADDLMKDMGYIIYDRSKPKIEVSRHIFNNEMDGKDYAGPLWLGSLWDSDIAEKMLEMAPKDDVKLYSLLAVINEEAKIDEVGFVDLHRYARLKGIEIPKIDSMIIPGEASRTHFLGWGIRAKRLP